MGRKLFKIFFVFLLVFSWLFTSWPPIWPLGGFDKLTTSKLGVNTIRIPPKIQEAKAATETLYPNGESTAGNNQFTYVGGSLDYTNLQTNDGDTSYADSTTSNNLEHTIHLDDPTGSGTINSVTVYLVVKYTTAAEDLGHMVVVGGTIYDLPALGTCAEFNSTSVYAIYSCQMTTSPATSAAWTWAEIAGMEAGIETDVMAASQYLTQVYAVVDYTPAAVVSVSVSDGVVTYGMMPANTSKTTLSGELNDMQTATNDGNVTETFNIKGQNTVCPWTLASSSGSDQYVHQFCNDTDLDCSSPPTNYTALTTSYQALDTGIAQSGTVNFQLRITVPTSTNCYTQQSVDVTIQAVQ